MIEVKNISKKYTTTLAVNNLNLTIHSNEITGILGPNGAGKTSLIKMITCYMNPTTGSLTVGGDDVAESPMEVRKKIGYLPEHAPIYTDTNVYDYLKFVAEVRKIPKKNIHPKIREVSKKLGLDEMIYKPIETLSKGYRQRVGLAQAIIHDPEILILDEPTTGLDPNQIVEIRNMIKELGKEKTVLFSTHILSEVQSLCDRVIIINKGEVVADGTPESLKNDIAGKCTLHLLVESNTDVVQLLKDIGGVIQVQLKNRHEEQYEFYLEHDKSVDIRKSVFKCCVQNNAVILEMKSEQASFEDVFKELTLEGGHHE